MVRFTLIELVTVELEYYPLIIKVDKCSGTVMSYLQKYVFQKK